MQNKFFKKILKNGMTLIFEKRDLPIVSLAFAVRTGGINEKKSEKGISHFIEHMLYKGTPKRNSTQIASEIEKNGGEINGFTDESVTAYYCKIPSKHLNIALDVLADMVKNPLFNKKEISKEREVIFEEIKMRKDNPRIFVLDEIHSCLYESPFGFPLIGSFETMNSLSREDLVQRFNSIYSPENMILSVVGDADIEKLVQFIEKNFPKKKGNNPQIPVVEKNESKIVNRKGIDQANLVFAYHIPNSSDDNSYSALVLNSLLSEGISSRLFVEIREKRNLAYSIKGETVINKEYAYNLIYVGTKKENVEKVKELILEEFSKVTKELSEKELSEVKEQIVGNYQISLEDSQVQMINLLNSEICGDAKRFYEFEEKIRKVNLSSVKTIAKDVLKKYSFLALVPE